MLEIDFFKIVPSCGSLLLILLLIFVPAYILIKHHTKTSSTDNLPLFRKISHSLKLNHENLFKQKLLIFTIQITSFYVLAFGILSWLGASPSLGYEAFNNFIIRSKLPLGILSISAAIILLISRAHATVQTERQINELERKNNVELFYKHREEFRQQLNKLLEAYIKSHKVKFLDTETSEVSYQFYKKIYNSSESTGIGQLNIEYIDNLIKKAENLFLYVREIHTKENLELIEVIHRASDLLNDVSNEVFNEAFETKKITVNFEYNNRINTVQIFAIDINTLRNYTRFILYTVESMMDLFDLPDRDKKTVNLMINRHELNQLSKGFDIDNEINTHMEDAIQFFSIKTLDN